MTFKAISATLLAAMEVKAAANEATHGMSMADLASEQLARMGTRDAITVAWLDKTR
ncbi:hypothetical protein [Stutzerimonas chloritidismutans]|uniref:hypothetical protein n=1 Tax=Stutzerimonas chloritidismutans TaxID=203192 RepID=UPI003F15316D